MEAVTCDIPEESTKVGDGDECTVAPAENIQTEQTMETDVADGTGSKTETDENMEAADAAEDPKLPAFGERRQDLYSSERFKLELNNLGKFSYGVSST